MRCRTSRHHPRARRRCLVRGTTAARHAARRAGTVQLSLARHRVRRILYGASRVYNSLEVCGVGWC